MPTKKTIQKTMKNAKTRSAKKSRSIMPRAAKLGQSTMSYAMEHSLPIGSVIGAGALTAAGYFLRGQLAELLETAIDTVGANLDPAKLLALAGVQRKRSFLFSMMPGLGGLAVGLVSGAALTYFLAPSSARSAVIEPITAGTPVGSVGFEPKPMSTSFNHAAP